MLEKTGDNNTREVYSFIEKVRNNQKINIKEFRKVMPIVQEMFVNHEKSMVGKQFDDHNPLEHSFGDGLYIRKIFMPAGQLMVTKIHKKKHPFFVLKGECDVVSENGTQKVKGPYNGITLPGTQRLIYVREDTIWITVHATDKTDLKEIEEEVIAKDFSDPLLKLK